MPELVAVEQGAVGDTLLRCEQQQDGSYLEVVQTATGYEAAHVYEAYDPWDCRCVCTKRDVLQRAEHRGHQPGPGPDAAPGLQLQPGGLPVGTGSPTCRRSAPSKTSSVRLTMWRYSRYRHGPH